VIVLSQHLRNELDRMFAADGLTMQQTAVLTAIDYAGSPSLGEIARALGTSHQNVKQIALALERKGFVRWADDRNDARVKRLVTTPKHARHWAKRNPRDHAQILAFLSDLDEDEARTLQALLRRVLRRLQESRA
jgi:DNA-binding MarR family transcriptional regulator